MNDRILNAAALLLPPDLRSRDAIRLATAQQLGGDLGQIATYDDRMVSAARLVGLRTASPA